MDRTTRTLIIVLILYALAIWIALPIDHPTIFGRDLNLKLGLDLKGGIRVLLEADVPPGEKIDAQAMEAVPRDQGQPQEGAADGYGGATAGRARPPAARGGPPP